MKLRWRRGIAALLSAVMLLSMPGGLELTAAAVESAQETEQSAVQLVDNEYELTFTNSGRTVAGYTGTPVDVTVPDGVTTIGGATFQNCQSLRSITLPASVTSISRYAFDSCSNLQTVTFAARLISVPFKTVRALLPSHIQKTLRALYGTTPFPAAPHYGLLRFPLA